MAKNVRFYTIEEVQEWLNITYTCLHCNRIGYNLNADHIVPLSYLIKENNIKTLEDAYSCEKLWDINNGRTLCEDCHKQTDTWAGKAINYQPQNTI